MKIYTMDGKWQLFFYDSGKYSPNTPDELEALSPECIEAKVPGNIELDLSRAGYLPEDLFFSDNISKTWDYEGYDFWYKTEFVKPEGGGGRCFIRFGAVDCIADYFVGSQKIGSSENAFIPHEFDITDIKEQRNTLYVHIKSPMRRSYDRKYKLFSIANSWHNHERASVYLRKPPHSFGWDIMPRSILGGIWREVEIVEKSDCELSLAYIYTKSIDSNKAHMNLCYDLDIPFGKKGVLKLEGDCEDSHFSFSTEIDFKSDNFEFTIHNPKLWWPKGYGEPSLYHSRLTFESDGEVLIDENITFGIRTVKLENSEISDGIHGKFVFVINGVEVMCRGSNWVPMDAMHSRDKERYKTALPMFDDIGCNIIRVWGGSVYEDREFYDYCDEHGIMVWQDFMMACHAYPIDDEFCAVLYDEAEVVIRMLRQHPSLILWSGDNECDAQFVHVNGLREINRLTREILPRAILENDVGRPYLPSSPLVVKNPKWMDEDEEHFSEAHLWGLRDFYKADFFTRSTAHFVSETGYYGCPDAESIKKFVPEGSLFPVMNRDWYFHSTDMHYRNDRTVAMTDQIYQLFGFYPDNLEDYVLASQFSQAEAKKFFIERIRVDKPTKTGIIWWNLVDGWPQMSDAVVDYYYAKKKAYNYIKRSMQPFFLMAGEIAEWGSTIYASNDTLGTQKGSYRITEISDGRLLAEGSFEVMPNSNKKLCKIPTMYSDHGMFLIEWEINGKKSINHYLHGYPAFDFEEYKKWHETLEKAYSEL